MGYFANSTEAEIYQARYCDRCANNGPETGCAVWDAHILRNYAECNVEDSILHALIPKRGLDNLQCAMFRAWDPERCTSTPDLFEAAS